MTFEGFDATLPIEASAMMVAMPAQAVAEGWTLEDALRQAGLGEGGTRDMAILDRRAARAELTVLDLWVDHPGAPQRTALDQLEQVRGAATLLAGAALIAVAELPSGKDLAVSAASSPPPQGGDYVDENGNGQWDPGEEILVNGIRPQTLDDDSGWVEFWSGGSGGGGGDGGDGGWGGPDSEPDDEPNDCRDRNALEAQDEIKAKSDYNHYEYGSLTYRDASGTVQHSPPIKGGIDNIPISQITAWMNANGVSFSQVIGWVHNHPHDTFGEGLAGVNRYPSGGDVPGGDWSAADWFVSHGAGGPGGADFALYIIDTTGKMREFEYRDRDTYKDLDAGERQRGDHLPSQVVSDGTSCG